MTFGTFCKERRLARRQSLREFSLEHSFDPVFLSGLERDKRPPPDERDLAELVRALALSADDQVTFRRLAEQATEAFKSGALPVSSVADYLPALPLPCLQGRAGELARAAMEADSKGDGRRLFQKTL